MNSTPLKRKTPLRAGKAKPKRDPVIPAKPRVDLSRMDCCPEAKARAQMLVMLPCCACGQRGTTAIPGALRRPDDMVVHHVRHGAGAGARAPWWRTLGLHEKCHANAYPVSVHGRRSDEFRRLYGDEEEMLARVNAGLPAALTCQKMASAPLASRHAPAPTAAP